jgi:uncharacterized caspase-like protein
VVAVIQMILASSVAADTLTGVALVVGQSDYASLPDLANTGRDAEAIENLLDDLGFDASGSTDRDARRLGRDLDGFLEDAEGADVAVLYYAGHAVEIGGENFLVPVDVDASSPQALARGLISLNDYVGALRRKAKVTIVILDACRDNPFPPGTFLRTGAGASPDAVEESGIGARGAARLSAAVSSADGSLGLVIAFAAEPGKVALDGDPGGNSPYAAAILRHLSAMSGAEFGTVMRLVAEEVYLKTGGRQRPWVNESLRRLLYFGEPVASLDGDEGAILAERRQLLLTIAALPEIQRSQVERAAAQGGVPMDAIFALLKALGQQVPEDPDQLDALLRAQTERVRAILADRATVSAQDPEIARLSALVDKAVADGAIETAITLNERIKARAGALDVTLEQAEATIAARRLELAEVYRKSAETYELAAEFLKAADDWNEAFRQAEGRDDARAWTYRNAEMDALVSHASEYADRAALARAVTAGREALAIAERLGERGSIATTLNGLGLALLTEAEWSPEIGRAEEAVAMLERAAAVVDRAAAPLQWARIQNTLAVTLALIGERRPDGDHLERAADAYRAALEERTRDAAAWDWAQTTNNLATLLVRLGEREYGTARFEEAVGLFRQALEIRTREALPSSWAMTTTNLAVALEWIGQRSVGTAHFEEAAVILQDALLARTQADSPLGWAATQSNLGNVLWRIGLRSDDVDWFRRAATAHRASLEEWTRERVPLDWAAAQNNLGLVLEALANRLEDPLLAEQAVASHRLALEVLRREVSPDLWANASHVLGVALRRLGLLRGDAALLKEATAAFEAALEVRRPDRGGVADWRASKAQLATTLATRAERGEPELLDAALAIDREVLAMTPRASAPLEWATAQNTIGERLFDLAARDGGLAPLEAAEAAFRAALEERRRHIDADAWATSKNNLGRAIFQIATDHGRVERAPEAAEAFAAAALGWRRQIDPDDWAIARGNAGLAEASHARATGDSAAFRRAARAFRDVLTVWTPERDAGRWARDADRLARLIRDMPRRSRQRSAELEGLYRALAAHHAAVERREDWAGEANSLAWNMVQAAKAGGDGAMIDQAIPLLREALDLQERDGDEASIGNTAESLCDALAEKARRTRDRATADEAMGHCRRSVLLLRQNRQETLAIAEATLARTDALVAELSR